MYRHERDPEAKARLDQADRLFLEEEYGDAMDLLVDLNITFPDEKEILIRMARCLARTCKFSQAQTLCTRLIEQFDSQRARDLESEITPELKREEAERKAREETERESEEQVLSEDEAARMEQEPAVLRAFYAALSGIGCLALVGAYLLLWIWPAVLGKDGPRMLIFASFMELASLYPRFGIAGASQVQSSRYRDNVPEGVLQITKFAWVLAGLLMAVLVLWYVGGQTSWRTMLLLLLPFLGRLPRVFVFKGRPQTEATYGLLFVALAFMSAAFFGAFLKLLGIHLPEGVVAEVQQLPHSEVAKLWIACAGFYYFALALPEITILAAALRGRSAKSAIEIAIGVLGAWLCLGMVLASFGAIVMQ